MRAADIICIRTILAARSLPTGRAARHCVIRYAKPRTLDEALALLGEARWQILAGGTDFYPALGSRPLSENVLDINGLAELRGISETASHIVDRRAHDLDRTHPPSPAPGLRRAEAGGARSRLGADPECGFGCRQSLQRLAGGGRRAGADGARRGGRAAAPPAAAACLPLGDFILGNRKTALRPDEMVTAIRVPKASTRRRVGLRKTRRAALSRHLDRDGGGAGRGRR